MNLFKYKFKLVSISLLSASLIACGGGGSGSGTPLAGDSYSGKTNEAVLTATSVNQINTSLDKSTTAMGKGSTGFNGIKSTFVSKSTASVKQLMNLNFQSNGIVTNAVAPPTNICQSGSAKLNSQSDNKKTGERLMSITFSNCTDSSGSVINGSTSIFEKYNITTGATEQLLMTFNDFSYKDSVDNYLMDGKISVVYSTSSETTTLNVVFEDKNTSEMIKFENFISVDTKGPNKMTEEISGKVFIASIGYITFKTIEPMVTLNGDMDPSSGILQIIGASETAGKKAVIQITYQSGNTYILEADLDGDGIFEINQSCNWSQACDIAA